MLLAFIYGMWLQMPVRPDIYDAVTPDFVKYWPHRPAFGIFRRTSIANYLSELPRNLVLCFGILFTVFLRTKSNQLICTDSVFSPLPQI